VRIGAVVLFCVAVSLGRPAARGAIETLHPVDALPVSLVGDVENPRGYVETSGGTSLVLDARSQTVFAIDRQRASVRRIITIGAEVGHILRPSTFSLGQNDVLAIADSPGDYSRIQYFGDDGKLIGWFFIANQPGLQHSLGGLSLEGPGTMAFSGRAFLISAPSTGWLMSEFDNKGTATRGVGALRPTGHESQRSVHAALNVGIPLTDRDGAVVFVFQTGRPMFRKYAADGALVFERHIEGVELDEPLAALPTAWPAQDAEARPFVPSLVRAAALDPKHRLWVSLSTGYTYVFDASGDKMRTVRFEASSPIEPTSLFFTNDGRLLVTPGCYQFSVD